MATENQQSPWSFGLQQSNVPMLPQAPTASAQSPLDQVQQQGQQQQSVFALLSQIMGHPQGQQALDLGSLLKQVRNDPQGDANKGYMPGQSNEYNPFSNGFFNFKQQAAPVPGDPNFIGPMQPRSPVPFGASAMPMNPPFSAGAPRPVTPKPNTLPQPQNPGGFNY